VSDRDGNSEIYTSPPDRWDPVNVTNDAADDTNPSWCTP